MDRNQDSPDEFSYEMKVPKDRVAVLIGKNGSIKKEIEEATRTSIRIDSKEGDLVIRGRDALKLYTAREVVKAIARGLNPEFAKLLLRQDYCLEIIRIDDYVRNKSHLPRLRGRLIGTEGKARRVIEELSETYICVYGKTVAIIGAVQNVMLARGAVEKLLSGSQHSSVFRYLEKKRAEYKRQELEGGNIGRP